MNLKLDEQGRRLVEEISALSGIQRDVVREVWEFTLMSWIEKITRDPEKLQTLVVPFLGNVGVRYKGDSITDEGGLESQAEAFVSLSPFFKNILGDVYDEKANLLIDILDKKIDDAVGSSADTK